MKVIEINNNIEISDAPLFNLEHTFECGQCFRWNVQEDGSYVGVHNGYALRIAQTDDKIILYNTEMSDFEGVWRKYFDLDRDYEAMQNVLKKDSVLKEAIADGYGIRILLQDPFEALISFIISQNNNIPRIKGIVERLCSMYGEKIPFEDTYLYSFPDAKTLASLTREDLAQIRAGFRDKYILDAAGKVISGEIDLDALKKSDSDYAKTELLKIKGVGEKVANCIVLFGLGFYDAFPVDVWIKRIMEHYYFDGEQSIETIHTFAKEKFGEYGGFAQQYLFYHARKQ